MRVSTRRKIIRVHKAFFGILTALGLAVATTTIMMFAVTRNLGLIAPFFLPTLAAFFGFSALLYNRARAYPAGAVQRRSLHAADLAMHATMLYLVALILGAIITSLTFDYVKPVPVTDFSFHSSVMFIALLCYWLPLLFVALSFMAFSDALRLFFVEIIIPRRLRADFRRMNK